MSNLQPPTPGRPPNSGRVIEASFPVSPSFLPFAIVGLIAMVVLSVILGVTVAVALVVVALAAGAVVFGKNIKAAFGWKPATIEVPDYPLTIGASIPITYRRRPRKVADLPSCAVHVKLICEERVTYQQGSDSRTDTARVFEQVFSGDGHGTPRGLEASVTINVPAHAGAPTFDLGDNEVHWALVATIRGPRLPDDEQRFPVIVGPALDPALRNQQGDR